MSMPQEIRVQPQPTYTRWLTEEVLNLIDLVRSNEAIYNPRHKYYFCRPYVENFWHEVDLRLKKNSGTSLAKWTNLRISFRREYANYLEEKIPPCWSYFDKMLFLHPYLRNKKSSEPKNLEPHIQEALAKLNGLTYKPLQTTCESPVNEYMDQYLSFCEDDPPTSPTVLNDIIEEANSNSVQNEVRSEDETESEEKPSILESDDFKDIIIEITDDTQPNSPLLNSQDGCVNRSLIKRPRIEIGAVTVNSNASSQSNNVSKVRPLALTSSSHPPEGNSFNNSIISSNRTEPPENPTAARRNDFCECKTDSDAMFLMSLLTDIRKLNGRDRGKIKIAFQNIVQEYLYPD